ncbi:Ig-like domain-containing protein [Phosphitispora sp. TUW77]|uniref:Ig-like domain-containing protein n=1 Tax=Phosphitispora sp. TUW77 TaxID=3152361 RepID=UPI003AB3A3A4
MVGESVNAPYSCDWQPDAGDHTLLAKAYDAAGNVGTSSSVSVEVPAKVTITNPVNGSTVSGVISNFDATFSDPVFGNVKLYIDGVYKAHKGVQDVTDVSISYNWDSTEYADGTTHLIMIRGYTENGKVLSSGISVVTVDN